MIKRILARVCLVTTLVLLTSADTVFAQGGATTSISGTVVDSGGGAVPGVAVVVKNDSGVTFETVTNGEGFFSVPSVDAGTYTVTASLSGFKTAVIKDVRTQPGQPISLTVKLEVGQLEETINVSSSSELLNTQTATISATLNSDQLNRMPTPTRNALNAVTFLPGVNTTGINRDASVNGLPQSFINITLDGVSNNDNFLRTTDGFFASVTPRQDAVEAVTVTTAVGGANVGGSGAAAINFATRSGTNTFSGSLYEYWRDPSLNSNTWFNERNGFEKNDVKLNQFGGRVGGPIKIPGLYDGTGKAFYFFHYEQLRFPNSFTRNRTVLNPAALNGTFLYDVGGETRSVNVLALAAANGQLATTDPTVMSVLQNIQSATGTTGTLIQQNDPLLQTYSWQSPGKLFEHQPTLRIDLNLGTNHRLSGSTQGIATERIPDYLNSTDARFPGAPNYRPYYSTRPLHTLALRSTLSPTLVSELRGGVTALGGSSSFGGDEGNGVQTFADQGGYAIDLDSNIGLTNWHTTNGPSRRAAPTFSIEENLTWQRGSHSVNFGGSFLQARAWEKAKQVVPGIDLRFDTTNDPAASLFTAANFSGASSAQLNDARDLYALLTGRVGSITGQAALDPDTNRYSAFTERNRAGYMNMTSLFAQDSWRVSPTLTLNAGLRWDLQMPFTPVNDTMSAATMASVCGVSGLGDGSQYNKCNFYSRAQGGAFPEFVQLTSGTRGYNTDWNNIAPNVSLAWRPNVQDGVLRTLLGDPEAATFRGGYSVAYDRQGLSTFTGVFGPNPGSILDLARNVNTGLVPPGESWPVLLRETDRLYNQPFPDAPTYPIVARPNRADNIRAFAPDIEIAYARTWTVSFQRSLSRDTAIDVRYVGTKGVNQWSTLNYNERDIIDNGFLDEFRLAMQNLQANNASGVTARRGSFAYFGDGSGTSPLPTYLAYLTGNSNASSPAAYTGTLWRDTSITTDLVAVAPRPDNSAVDLDGTLARRQNAAAAGLPANFFIVNPDVTGNLVTDSGAFSGFHALQIDLRRRLSRGLSANLNYQYGIETGSTFDGFRFGRSSNPVDSVRHAIKTQWDWTIPVGRGQRFGANMNPILEGILGGWSFNGVGRIQSTVVDFGNVRLVGMTEDDLTDMYRYDIRVNPANGLETPYVFPDDVILNTRRAFNFDPTSATGYSSLGAPEGRYFAPANSAGCIQVRAGDCAPRTVMIRTPFFTRFDVGVAKRFALKGRSNLEIRLDLLNVFDNINFNTFEPGDISTTQFTAYSSADFGQVTSAYSDSSNTFDPGGRLGQLMFRFNW